MCGSQPTLSRCEVRLCSKRRLKLGAFSYSTRKAAIQRPQLHIGVAASIDLETAGSRAVCLPRKELSVGPRASVVVSPGESGVVEIAYRDGNSSSRQQDARCEMMAGLKLRRQIGMQPSKGKALMPVT